MGKPDNSTELLGHRKASYFFKQLLLTGFAVMVPVILLLGYTLHDEARRLEFDAHLQVLQGSQQSAEQADEILQRIEGVLSFMHGREEIRQLDPTRCATLLNSFAGIDQLIRNVGVFDLQGHLLCDARPATRPLPTYFGERWYQEGLNTEGPVFTTPNIGAISGRPIDSLIDGIRDSNGKKIGLLVVTIDLARLSQVALSVARLPAGATATLVNPKGEVVGRTPDVSKWVGVVVPALMGVHRDGMPEGVASLQGIDGVERVYASSPLPGHPWRVFVGVPLENITTLLRRNQEKTALVLVLAAASSFALAWFGARRLARPVGALALTAQRLADGEQELRADEGQPGEVGVLAIEFNRMVQGLLDREQQLEASEKTAVRLSRFYRALSEARKAAGSAKTASELFQWVSDLCVASEAAQGAWVGVASDGGVRPVTWSDSACCVSKWDFEWASKPDPWGLIASAVETGLPVVSNDLARDPRVADAVKERAQRAGVRGAAAFPIRCDDSLTALLVVHMAEPGVLDEGLVQLLEEIAADVSRALDGLKKEQERQLALNLEKAANARFLSVFNVMPVPSALYAIPDGEILQVNEAFCASYGMPREHLLGHTLAEAGLGLDKAGVDAYRTELLGKGRIRNLEARIAVAGGRHRDVLMSAEIIEFHGKECALSLHVDISDRRRAETALREREQQLASIVDGALDGILTVDARHRLLVYNDSAARIFGVPVEDAIGKSIDRFIPDSLKADYRARVDRLLRGPTPRKAVHRLLGLRADGTEFPLETSVSRLGSGEVATVTFMLRDVSELEQARESALRHERAMAANQAKTEFLSQMSHELRTPLNAVLGFSRLLQDSTKGRLQDSEVEQLDMIFLGAAQLRALIDDVLDISRIETGKLQFELRPVEIQSVLDGVLKLSDSLAKSHEVRLIREASSALTVRTDPIRIRQVFLNIITNAIKYNRTGGEVRVSATYRDQAVVVSIEDTGIGMSVGQMERLYEPFNRLGRERSEVSGTGIGLALTRQLVELLGGNISISSVEGVGTRALVSLPATGAGGTNEPLPAPSSDQVAQADATAAKPGVAPAHGAPAGVVLYIEDNPVNVVLVQQLLKRWTAVHLVVAHDGATGVRFAKELRPDVVLLDMQLPDIDGQEVLSQLRADETTRGLQIVALSANAMAEEIQEALDSGADDYWTKPIDFGQFLAKFPLLLA